MGPEAEIKGNVTAPSLAVGAGAVLEGQYAIGPQGHTPQPPPDGDVEDDDDREDAA